MKFLGLSVSPDLMGRRLRIRWSYALAPGETPGQVPDVLLRRKERDFAFPPLVLNDPFLVHDSATFPPSPVVNVLAVTDLADMTLTGQGTEGRRETISVAAITGSQRLETQRWARTVWRDPSGQAVQVDVELLDAAGLVPGTGYYFELDDGSAPSPEDLPLFRGFARAGEVFGHNRQFWQMIPDSYRGADAQLMPAAALVEGIPETSRSGGQLKRFVDVFGMGVDLLRNGAEGLRSLRDPETTPAPMLAALGRQLGWPQAPALPVEQTRNEVETATRLFALGGTVQAMRALVMRQAGWYAQAAEMHANLWRSGMARQGIVRFRRESPAALGAFVGGLDAAPVFGFPAAGASGGAGLPAILTSGAIEPFALLSGQSLTLSVNGGVPTRIVFGPADFERMDQARAVEVAQVIARNFDDITAIDQAGRVVLATLLDSPEARLTVETARESLLTLSAAPSGRISPLIDADGHLLLAYLDRETRPRSDGSETLVRLARLKSWGHGRWHDASAVPDLPDDLDQVSATMAGSAIMAAFSSPQQGMRLTRALPRGPQSASLTTPLAEPFALQAGQVLRLLTEAGAETYVVNAADFVDLTLATTTELAAAINAQLALVTAQPLPDGCLRLLTVSRGDLARLSVDLANSTVARILGLARRGWLARGSWRDDPVWGLATQGPALASPCSDLTVAAFAGGVQMAWAEHAPLPGQRDSGTWTIRTAHWQDGAMAATPAGLAERQGQAGPWVLRTTVDGLPSNAVRACLRTARGVVAVATDQGVGLRPVGLGFSILDTVGGLPSNDVRALACLPGGDLVAATSAGLAEVSPAGAVTVTTAAPQGLQDNDTAALCALPDGRLLVGHASGLSQRDRLGRWQSASSAQGLPPGAIGAVAAQGDWILAGNAAGLSLWDGATWRPLGLAQGLPSTMIRAVHADALGVLIATDQGLALWSRHQGPGLPDRFTALTPAQGLPFADCRSVTRGLEDRLLVGGAAGLAVSSPAGALPFRLEGAAQGLPVAAVAGVFGPVSTPMILAEPPGGAVEPHLAATTDGRLWCAFAARDETVATERDSWTLRLRRFDPGTAIWGAEQAVTTVPVQGCADREPFILPQAAGGARIFLSTDRSGGRGLAEITLTAAGAVGTPLATFPADPAENWAPSAVPFQGEVWLFHRGDRAYAPSQIATLDGNAARPASLRLADATALATPAGLRTPVLAHLPRHALRALPGDPMAYLPEEPDRWGQTLADPVPLHTRRTIALHMSLAPSGVAPTQDQVARLVQLLNEFKPLNTRLRLIIRPPAVIELLYPPGADIGEAWEDRAPFVERLAGPREILAVAYPGLAVLIADDIGSLSAAPGLPASLRRRTWFPDLI